MTSQVRRGVLGGISYGWGLGIVNAGAVLLGLRLDVAPALVAGHLTAFSIGLFLVGISDLLLLRPVRVASPVLLGLAGLGLLLAPSVIVSLAAALAVGATGSVVLALSQRQVTAGRPDDRWLMWTNASAALAVAASSGLVAVLDTPLLVALPGLLAGVAATTSALPSDDDPSAATTSPRDATPIGPGGPDGPRAGHPDGPRAGHPDGHPGAQPGAHPDGHPGAHPGAHPDSHPEAHIDGPRARVPIPDQRADDGTAPARTVDPRLLLLAVLAVGTELTLANRLPDHLARSGLDGIAAIAPALVYVGVAAARAWLAVRPPRPLPAVAISAGLVAVAVFTLLLLGNPGLAVVAVLGGGMGAGALFPLVAAATLASATDPSRTSARITAMVGLGTGVTPLAVGFADGIAGGAFWLVLPMAAAVALLARRLANGN